MKPVKTKSMKPEEIRAEMALHKVRPIEIAREIGVSPTSVTRVINLGFISTRIQAAISARTKIPFERMWGRTPDNYRIPIKTVTQ